jgi:uncharacterized protein (DUF433 family)
MKPARLREGYGAAGRIGERSSRQAAVSASSETFREHEGCSFSQLDAAASTAGDLMHRKRLMMQLQNSIRETLRIKRASKSVLRQSNSRGILIVVSSVVSQDPEILGGEPVFTGTRVPVKSLFDHLEAGDSIEQFLEGFPSVKREQVIALLEEAREHALSAS